MASLGYKDCINEVASDPNSKSEAIMGSKPHCECIWCDEKQCFLDKKGLKIKKCSIDALNLVCNTQSMCQHQTSSLGTFFVSSYSPILFFAAL